MLLGNKIIGTVGYLGGLPTLPEPFVWSWSNMVQYNHDYVCEPGQTIHYTHAPMSYHSAARNYLVGNMKGDWLLMLDTDHEFDPDILARMLRVVYKHDLPVLTALYQYKTEPFNPKIYRWRTKNNLEPIGNWDKSIGVDAMEIGAAGAGCLLVRKEVFKKIETDLKEEPFDIHMPFGEDNSFFWRLKKLGIKPYVAVNIEYPHLALQKITMADYSVDDVQLARKRFVEGAKLGG